MARSETETIDGQPQPCNLCICRRERPARASLPDCHTQYRPLIGPAFLLATRTGWSQAALHSKCSGRCPHCTSGTLAPTFAECDLLHSEWFRFVPVSGHLARGRV